MSNKSYVTVEQNVCPVCAKKFDTGALLLDKRLKDRFERTTVTGWDLCPECKAKKEDGFVALVEIDKSKSTGMGLGDVWRTGNIAWLKTVAFAQIFDQPIPEKMIAFMEPGVIEKLQRFQSDE